MNKIKESYKSLIKGENPNFILYLIPVIGILVLILLPFLLTRCGFKSFDFTNTGEIGDTIGGISGPVIALLAAVLTFFAFWVQLQANKNQTTQFDNQDTDTKINRFETKYFELIRLHRENLSEISIYNGLIKGRKAFISMFNEYQFCYYVLKTVYEIEKSKNKNIHDLKEFDIVNISYLVFFMGVGKNSNKLTESLILLDNKFVFDAYLLKLEEYRKNWDKGPMSVYKDLETKESYTLTMKYKPFGGHISRLGHYYRHLFQTVKFVVSQDDKVISDKYFYIKMLRAQLSDYEQLLLYYNCLSMLGKPWNDNNYIKDYRFIKNIPLPLADFGILPRIKYGSYDKQGKLLFEWDEIMGIVPSR